MQRFEDRVALITGGSRGIGFACAMGFAAEGCTVHIASRSKESLESAREKIRARHNVPVEIHHAGGSMLQRRWSSDRRSARR